MNLDLLIKLTKLANHNPNENEANAAARKVCKLLEESKFSLNGVPITQETKKPTPPPSTYGGQTRSQERPWTGNPYQYGNPFDYGDIFGDFFTSANRAQRAAEEARRRAEDKRDEEAKKKWRPPPVQYPYYTQCYNCRNDITVENRNVKVVICNNCKTHNEFVHY